MELDTEGELHFSMNNTSAYITHLCTHLNSVIELTLVFLALLKFGQSVCVLPPWPLVPPSQHTHCSTVAPT